MGRSAQNARAIACGITTRIQRSHHAADGSHVGGLGYRASERRGPRAENTSLPAAANRRNRLGQGKGNRERLAGGAKSQNRGSTAANGRRREIIGRARRTGGSVGRDRGNDGTDELSTTSSAMWTRFQHRLRLHAGFGDS